MCRRVVEVVLEGISEQAFRLLEVTCFNSSKTGLIGSLGLDRVPPYVLGNGLISRPDSASMTSTAQHDGHTTYQIGATASATESGTIATFHGPPLISHMDAEGIRPYHTQVIDMGRTAVHKDTAVTKDWRPRSA